MKRVDSVISLIYSMSKAEKKAFSVQMLKDKEEKDYLVIYDIITKSKQQDSKNVKGEFHKRRPDRKSTRLNSSHASKSRMPSSA